MRPVPRRLISTSRSSKSASPSAALGAPCAAGAAALALYGYSQHANALDLEAEPGKKNWQPGQAKELKPEVFLWGRNSHGVASPSGSSTSNQVKRPTASAALSSLVLRDLALSATYGVAVDAKGDVLQWGQGFAGPQETGTVEKTLTGKDLIKVVPTEEGKVFGLSKKGEVWVWASEKRMQRASSDVVDLPREVESAGWMWLLGKGTLWGRNANGSVETLKLKPDVPLARGEKFTSLSAGASHLLALTSHGRSFAVPLCLLANQYGQLGVRSVSLLSPPHPGSSPAGALTVLLEPEDRLNELGWDKQPAQPKKIDPLLLPAVSPPSPNDPNPKGQVIPFLDIPVPSSSPAALVTHAEPARITLHPDPAQHAVLERSIHFCTTLHEIPSLRGVPVVELVAGKKHSLARLGGSAEGRVLGWGANSYGQLGLGPALSYPLIPAPTEVPLIRAPAYSGGANRPAHVACTRIAAGGNVSYFVAKTEERGVDLLASGQGQFGALGHGQWAHATSPVRVKTVSGLREWNEETGKVESVGIKDIQAGDGHVAVVLDNAVKHADGSAYGRDVFVWGYNEHYQLGTGKRSNLPTPQHLAPLPYSGASPTALAAALPDGPAKAESTLSSGTTSPMPHKRMQLSPALPVPSLAGVKLPRGAVVEEAIVAGDGGSGVYFRVVNP
ncbi:uncharacterized protein JCM10292_006439 [Rhodotorula paludigena]|uniref:uncharacterized protein n=1 Tax=Rhodotorula paludigena TaxID=86838 RepID=UPI003180D85A